MFRFTIRELVLLTLVVALAIAWWADHWAILRRWSDEYGKQRQTIRALETKLDQMASRDEN